MLVVERYPEATDQTGPSAEVLEGRRLLSWYVTPIVEGSPYLHFAAHPAGARPLAALRRSGEQGTSASISRSRALSGRMPCRPASPGGSR